MHRRSPINLGSAPTQSATVAKVNGNLGPRNIRHGSGLGPRAGMSTPPPAGTELQGESRDFLNALGVPRRNRH